jgi:hypothetical protein
MRTGLANLVARCTEVYCRLGSLTEGIILVPMSMRVPERLSVEGVGLLTLLMCWRVVLGVTRPPLGRSEPAVHLGVLSSLVLAAPSFHHPVRVSTMGWYQYHIELA